MYVLFNDLKSWTDFNNNQSCIIVLQINQECFVLQILNQKKKKGRKKKEVDLSVCLVLK